MEYTIDNLLLYSRCPTELFFSERLGVDSSATLRGQINEALTISCRTYMNNIETDPEGRGAGTKFNTLMSRIIPPSESRGGGSSRTNFQKSMAAARHIYDNCRHTIQAMECEVLGSPYVYTMTINNTAYTGMIDAVLIYRDTYNIVTLDLSVSEPSDDMLEYGLRASVAAYAFRSMEITSDYQVVHWWLPGNRYTYVDRSPGQFNAIGRELEVLARLYQQCTSEGLWYRRKGFWCNNCHIKDPCNEIRY